MGRLKINIQHSTRNIQKKINIQYPTRNNQHPRGKISLDFHLVPMVSVGMHFRRSASYLIIPQDDHSLSYHENITWLFYYITLKCTTFSLISIFIIISREKGLLNFVNELRNHVCQREHYYWFLPPFHPDMSELEPDGKRLRKQNFKIRYNDTPPVALQL